MDIIYENIFKINTLLKKIKTDTSVIYEHKLKIWTYVYIIITLTKIADPTKPFYNLPNNKIDVTKFIKDLIYANTDIKKYTVNRASFVYKNAREQFEMRIHRRLIDIINPNAKVIEALTNISLPSGVNIDVKMI